MSNTELRALAPGLCTKTRLPGRLYVQTSIEMGNQMFGTRPTDEEIAEVRKILGAPAAKKQQKPKAKVKARKR